MTFWRALDWIGYVFGRGRRRAWCEISGGHKIALAGTFTGGVHASHVQFSCERCGFVSKWHPTPTHELSERQLAMLVEKLKSRKIKSD